LGQFGDVGGIRFETSLSWRAHCALAGHGAGAVRDAIAATITTSPEQLRRSLTWDQGAEMAEHAKLRIDTGLAVRFCNRHSPWQRAPKRTQTGSCASTF
jgi:IS30 family transposase